MQFWLYFRNKPLLRTGDQVMARTKNRPAETGVVARKQALFVYYFTAVLIDLVVIGLLDEYWAKVEVNSFTTVLLAALLLQILLKFSIAIEHKVGKYFRKKTGVTAKILRFLSAWFILFVSKLVMLWAIDVAFGDNFDFHGKMHGVIPFLVLIVVIITAETLVQKIFFALGPLEDE